MEVDLVDGDVVDFGFGVAKELEGVDGEGLDGGREWGGLDEGADDGEGAAVDVRVGVIVLVVVFVCVGFVGVGVGVLFVGVGLAGLVEVLGLGVPGVLVSVGVLVDSLVGVAGRDFAFGRRTTLEHGDLGGGDAGAVDRVDLERCAEVHGGGGCGEDF